MERILVSNRMGTLARAVCASLVLFAAGRVDAHAQAFVTGSGSTDGFAVIGSLRAVGAGLGVGHFKIIVHRDTPENGLAAVICEYWRFTEVAFQDNRARFRSAGTCIGLTTAGGVMRFASDNVFGIVDNGEPGAGADTIDVNFLGASGVAIPGSFLVDGNFIVSP